MAKVLLLILLVMATFPATAWPDEPTYRQGVDIFIETGVTTPDREPTWYAPMVAQPYAPVFEILATRGTQGRYYPYTYAVTLKDIIKWHGHDCEGLVHGANMAKVAFNLLFPDSIIDRSVLQGISGDSPCLSDTIAFLTGARIQYGNLGFFKDKKYGHAIILYRTDTKMAVMATWKKGINNIPGETVVLPEAITWKPKINMQEVLELKKLVKESGGKPTPYQVDQMRFQQWQHVNDILNHPLEESYQAKVMENFKWEDWVNPGKTISQPHPRSDIRLKDYPYRPKPIAGPK